MTVAIFAALGIVAMLTWGLGTVFADHDKLARRVRTLEAQVRELQGRTS